MSNKNFSCATAVTAGFDAPDSDTLCCQAVAPGPTVSACGVTERPRVSPVKATKGGSSRHGAATLAC